MIINIDWKREKKEVINLIQTLKENWESQYAQFLEIKDMEKRLLFFWYPDFEHDLGNLNDFPDPWEYLIGFFISPTSILNRTILVLGKTEKEIPLTESISTPSK